MPEVTWRSALWLKKFVERSADGVGHLGNLVEAGIDNAALDLGNVGLCQTGADMHLLLTQLGSAPCLSKVAGEGCPLNRDVFRDVELRCRFSGPPARAVGLSGHRKRRISSSNPDVEVSSAAGPQHII
jgi:hypothetical protein